MCPCCKLHICIRQILCRRSSCKRAAFGSGGTGARAWRRGGLYHAVAASLERPLSLSLLPLPEHSPFLLEAASTLLALGHAGRGRRAGHAQRAPSSTPTTAHIARLQRSPPLRPSVLPSLPHSHSRFNAVAAAIIDVSGASGLGRREREREDGTSRPQTAVRRPARWRGRPAGQPSSRWNQYLGHPPVPKRSFLFHFEVSQDEKFPLFCHSRL